MAYPKTLLVLLHFLLLPLWAHGQYNYVTNNGTITITGYTGPGGSVTIPAMINGLPVSEIGSVAFIGRESLTNVVISEGIAKIGNLAFISCSNLESVSLPNSLTNIAEHAFDSCHALTNMFIPSGVTTIGLLALNNCSALTAIEVDAANPSFSSIDGVLVDKSQTTLLQFPAGKGQAYVIPQGITNIGQYAMFSVLLTNVTIPNSVLNIEAMAFWQAFSLTGIEIPNSVVSIGEHAFYGCSAMTNLTISQGVTNIGQAAFADCSSLTTITLPDSLTAIPNYLFGDCEGLTNIVIPSSVTRIGDGAFKLCVKLAQIDIPASVTHIGNEAFSHCFDLTAIRIPDNVTTLLGSAFSGCSSLTNVVVGNGVTVIEGSTFYGCRSLTEITIGHSVTNIGSYWSYTFHDCSSLHSIRVNPLNPTYSSLDGVLFNKTQTSLLQFPFAKTGEYRVPNSVLTIGSNAFNSCIGDLSVIVGDNVTNIANEAFADCTGLTRILLGNGISAIGDSSFRLCFKLTEITIPDSVSTIGKGAFLGSGLTNVVLGNNVADIGEFAFQDCFSLTRIVIPAGVTNIGPSAFKYASALTAIYLLGDAPAVGFEAFYGTQATIFYLPGTLGWSSTFGNRPTALWNASARTSDPEFGAGPHGFGFDIVGSTNIPVAVEASIDLASWTLLQSSTLTNGLIHFNDPEWTNYPNRVYRIRSP